MSNRWRSHHKVWPDTRPRYLWEIRRRFKRLRKKLHVTQAGLGNLIGLTQKAVSQIECRHVRPRPSTWMVFEKFEAVHRQKQIKLRTTWD
jgi:DNA-binding XRE family transcriptional regulator